MQWTALFLMTGVWNHATNQFFAILRSILRRRYSFRAIPLLASRYLSISPRRVVRVRLGLHFLSATICGSSPPHESSVPDPLIWKTRISTDWGS